MYRSVHLEPTPLFYSYDTCSSDNEEAAVNSFLESVGRKSSSTLKNVTLRVGIPYSYLPFHGRANEMVEDELYEDDSVPFQGIIVDYMSEMERNALAMGDHLHFSFTWTSRGSRSKMSSRWTATVSDVQKGLIDAAASDFWATQERLELAAFTVPISFEVIYLWVPKPGKQDFWQDVVKVFKPFSYDMWGALVGIVFFLGALDIWLDSHPTHRNLRNSFAPFPSHCHRANSLLIRLSKSTSHTAAELVGGSISGSEAPMTAGRKVLQLTWGFFITITISAYTANLASFLTRTDIGSHWYDVASVTKDSGSICINEILCGEARGRWPNAYFVCTAGSQDTFDGIRDGRCQAMAFSRDAVKLREKWARLVCEYELVHTGVVLEVPIALPAAPLVAAGLSYYIQALTKQGVTMHSFLSRYYLTDTCQYTPEASITLGALNRLNLRNFTGVFLMLLAGAGAAVISALANRSHARDLAGNAGARVIAKAGVMTRACTNRTLAGAKVTAKAGEMTRGRTNHILASSGEIVV